MNALATCANQIEFTMCLHVANGFIIYLQCIADGFALHCALPHKAQLAKDAFLGILNTFNTFSISSTLGILSMISNIKIGLTR